MPWETCEECGASVWYDDEGDDDLGLPYCEECYEREISPAAEEE